MQRKVYRKENNPLKKIEKTSNKKHIKSRKLSVSKIRMKNFKEVSISKKQNKFQYFMSKIFQKQNLVFVSLIVIDIILMIFFAKKNVVNYVKFVGEEIFVGETKNLLLGRNYITLVVTVFFFIYTIILQKFFFQRKVTKKYLISLFFFYFILNLVLFCLFTKRVY